MPRFSEKVINAVTEYRKSNSGVSQRGLAKNLSIIPSNILGEYAYINGVYDRDILGELRAAPLATIYSLIRRIDAKLNKPVAVTA